MWDVWEEHPSEVADLGERLASLSRAEQARTRRYRTPAAQRLFVTAWSLTRRVLGQLTDADPRTIRFDRACSICGDRTHGKPRLVDGSLHFSMSHVGDRVLLAVSDGSAVGVDIEACERDATDISKWILHPSEAAVTGRDLLRVWVRKEAVLKASGFGLTIPMSSFSLSAPPATVAVHDLPRADGYLAALATVQ